MTLLAPAMRKRIVIKARTPTAVIPVNDTMIVVDVDIDIEIGEAIAPPHPLPLPLPLPIFLFLHFYCSYYSTSLYLDKILDGILVFL